MFKIIVALSVIACAFGAAVPGGMLPQLDGRIVGGEATSIEKIPWQVSIQKYNFHFCGGSIYSSKLIVTAAHCLYGIKSPNTLKVRAGSTDRSSGGVLLDVIAFKIHEEFNMYLLQNDIGLIKLSSALPYEANIAPIPLATASPADGAIALVSGWGRITSGGPSYNGLRSANVNIVSQKNCSSPNFEYGDMVLETMICAYAVGKDSCQGDSGGPLVSGGVLVGIVSWGLGCADENYPGVYADVADLHSWVNKTAASL